MHHRTKISFAAALSAAFLLAGCVVAEKKDAPVDSAAVSSTQTLPPAQPMPIDSATMAMGDTSSTTGMRVEVDLTARKLTFYKGADSTETYPVAVGSEKWPTQPGNWTIKQVVWNPEWTPPDESWAEEREPRKPGDPKNPLGRAQLVYDPPRTIHGTNQPTSIGKNVSHGSIRMRNEDITKLGRELMEMSGVGKDSAFYRGVATKRTEKVVVDLPKPVPIRVF
jgi:lipoprotein-anchoring transpeptidase ErfK/SrfK